MKQSAFILLMILIAIRSSGENKKSKSESVMAFYIGTNYASTSRPEFDDYMAIVSDSMSLSRPLIGKHGIGLALGVVFKNNKAEFELGGGYVYGLSVVSNNVMNHTTEKLSTSTFDIHIGYNYYFTEWAFAGMDIGTLSNQGKFTTSGTTNAFESTPESANPFKGYIFFTRPKVGIFLPFKKGKPSGIKVNAFYDLGLTKYKFYTNDIFPQRLKNYNGATKTSYRGFGIQVTFSIG